MAFLEFFEVLDFALGQNLGLHSLDELTFGIFVPSPVQVIGQCLIIEFFVIRNSGCGSFLGIVLVFQSTADQSNGLGACEVSIGINLCGQRFLALE